MTKDEALRLAWDALEDIGDEWGFTSQRTVPKRKEAITAIKEALAQPEPNYKKALEVWLDKTEWVQETVKPHELGMHRADVLKQRIEAALAQPEPVAWLITDEKINSLQVDSIQRLIDRARHAHMTDIKLRINGQDEWYQADWLKHLTRTTPPQRTWVGLTLDERIELAQDVDWAIGAYCEYAEKIEAKLKAKNVL